jgi:hypothetical protein
MKTEAIAAGAKLIESEGALDQEFATIANRANWRASRRAAQKYHLTTAALLTPSQKQ